MTFRELTIPGSWEITPQVHADLRGDTFEWFSERTFAEIVGHRLGIAQVNCAVSAAGVVRGLHFAEVPPGQAKYVTCVRGAIFDVVVDVRVGSPTFGRWDGVVLDDVERRSMYLSEGLAHGYLALQDNSTVMYLCSTPYWPAREHTIAAHDPQIAIEWPLPPNRHVMSPRDVDAPTLAQARAAGVLPSWEETRRFVADLP